MHAPYALWSLPIVRYRQIPWDVMILSAMHSAAQLASMMMEYLWAIGCANSSTNSNINSASETSDDDFFSVYKSELCDKQNTILCAFSKRMCYRFLDFSPYHSTTATTAGDENTAHSQTECYKLLENTFLLLV